MGFIAKPHYDTTFCDYAEITVLNIIFTEKYIYLLQDVFLIISLTEFKGLFTVFLHMYLVTVEIIIIIISFQTIK